MSGFHVGGERVIDGADGIMAALLQCTEDDHPDGLAVGAALAAVAVAVFANDDGRTNDSFRMIVLERNIRLIQECEQILAVAAQAFDQMFRLLVFPRRIDQQGQSLVARAPRPVVCSTPAKANTTASRPCSKIASA